VPALALLGGLPMPIAVGTSLIVIAMKSFAGLAGFLGHTSIDWELGVLVSAFAVAGAVAGARLACRVAPERLRVAFGWFVISMALFMLGTEVPALFGARLAPELAVLGAVASTALLLLGRAWLRARRRPRPPDRGSTAPRVSGCELGETLE
jgi:hypothetical protein